MKRLCLDMLQIILHQWDETWKKWQWHNFHQEELYCKSIPSNIKTLKKLKACKIPRCNTVKHQHIALQKALLFSWEDSQCLPYKQTISPMPSDRDIQHTFGGTNTEGTKSCYLIPDHPCANPSYSERLHTWNFRNENSVWVKLGLWGVV